MFAGRAEDAAVLERLQAALSAYVGSLPYHNFTKRRLYRPDGKGMRKPGKSKPQREPRAASGAAKGADAAKAMVEDAVGECTCSL